MYQKFERKLTAFLDAFDIFSGTIPQFNFLGRQRMHTHLGVVISSLVYVSVLIYATSKCMDFY